MLSFLNKAPSKDEAFTLIAKRDWTKLHAFLRGAHGPAALNARDPTAQAPLLHWACNEGHEQTVLLLLHMGADIHAVDGKHGGTALMWAAGKGNVMVCRILIKAGVSVNDKDNMMRSALGWAAGNGMAETCKELLVCGAMVNWQDHWGRTALHWAVCKGAVNAVMEILNYRPDLSLQDHRGRTPSQSFEPSIAPDIQQLIRQLLHSYYTANNGASPTSALPTAIGYPVAGPALGAMVVSPGGAAGGGGGGGSGGGDGGGGGSGSGRISISEEVKCGQNSTVAQLVALIGTLSTTLMMTRMDGSKREGNGVGDASVIEEHVSMQEQQQQQAYDLYLKCKASRTAVRAIIEGGVAAPGMSSGGQGLESYLQYMDTVNAAITSYEEMKARQRRQEEQFQQQQQQQLLLQQRQQQQYQQQQPQYGVGWPAGPQAPPPPPPPASAAGRDWNDDDDDDDDGVDLLGLRVDGLGISGGSGRGGLLSMPPPFSQFGRLYSSSSFSLPPVETYSIQQLERACDGWSKNRIVGEGGFGKVYSGTINGLNIAVKKLDANSLQGRIQFDKEVELLSKIRHVNVVLLVGKCVEPIFCLVYKLMPNNSLRYHLDSIERRRRMHWTVRIQIATDVCVGLQYLHSDEEECDQTNSRGAGGAGGGGGSGETPRTKSTKRSVIHGDIKPENILLDADMHACLSDFGISAYADGNEEERASGKEAGACPGMVRMESALRGGLIGTFGYMSKSFNETGNMSKGSDIFAFGVVLMELLTGDTVYSSEKKPPLLVDRVVGAIESGSTTRLKVVIDECAGWKKNAATPFAHLASQCCANKGSDRPSLRMIEMELDTILRCQSPIPALAAQHNRNQSATSPSSAGAGVGSAFTSPSPSLAGQPPPPPPPPPPSSMQHPSFPPPSHQILLPLSPDNSSSVNASNGNGARGGAMLFHPQSQVPLMAQGLNPPQPLLSFAVDDGQPSHQQQPAPPGQAYMTFQQQQQSLHQEQVRHQSQQARQESSSPPPPPPPPKLGSMTSSSAGNGILNLTCNNRASSASSAKKSGQQPQPPPLPPRTSSSQCMQLSSEPVPTSSSASLSSPSSSSSSSSSIALISPDALAGGQSRGGNSGGGSGGGGTLWGSDVEGCKISHSDGYANSPTAVRGGGGGNLVPLSPPPCTSTSSLQQRPQEHQQEHRYSLQQQQPSPPQQQQQQQWKSPWQQDHTPPSTPPLMPATTNTRGSSSSSSPLSSSAQLLPSMSLPLAPCISPHPLQSPQRHSSPSAPTSFQQQQHHHHHHHHLLLHQQHHKQQQQLAGGPPLQNGQGFIEKTQQQGNNYNHWQRPQQQRQQPVNNQQIQTLAPVYVERCCPLSSYKLSLEEVLRAAHWGGSLLSSNPRLLCVCRTAVRGEEGGGRKKIGGGGAQLLRQQPGQAVLCDLWMDGRAIVKDIPASTIKVAMSPLKQESMLATYELGLLQVQSIPRAMVLHEIRGWEGTTHSSCNSTKGGGGGKGGGSGGGDGEYPTPLSLWQWVTETTVAMVTKDKAWLWHTSPVAGAPQRRTHFALRKGTADTSAALEGGGGGGEAAGSRRMLRYSLSDDRRWASLSALNDAGQVVIDLWYFGMQASQEFTRGNDESEGKNSHSGGAILAFTFETYGAELICMPASNPPIPLLAMIVRNARGLEELRIIDLTASIAGATADMLRGLMERNDGWIYLTTHCLNHQSPPPPRSAAGAGAGAGAGGSTSEDGLVPFPTALFTLRQFPWNLNVMCVIGRVNGLLMLFDVLSGSECFSTEDVAGLLSHTFEVAVDSDKRDVIVMTAAEGGQVLHLQLDLALLHRHVEGLFGEAEVASRLSL